MMDVIGIAGVDDEEVGVEEDHRLPRLWSSASFHDVKGMRLDGATGLPN